MFSEPQTVYGARAAQHQLTGFLHVACDTDSLHSLQIMPLSSTAQVSGI